VPAHLLRDLPRRLQGRDGADRRGYGRARVAPDPRMAQGQAAAVVFFRNEIAAAGCLAEAPGPGGRRATREAP
jgi:hypothetical protein